MTIDRNEAVHGLIQRYNIGQNEANLLLNQVLRVRTARLVSSWIAVIRLSKNLLPFKRLQSGVLLWTDKKL